jgi:hypothetical protein
MPSSIRIWNRPWVYNFFEAKRRNHIKLPSRFTPLLGSRLQSRLLFIVWNILQLVPRFEVPTVVSWKAHCGWAGKIDSYPFRRAPFGSRLLGLSTITKQRVLAVVSWKAHCGWVGKNRLVSVFPIGRCPHRPSIFVIISQTMVVKLVVLNFIF